MRNMPRPSKMCAPPPGNSRSPSAFSPTCRDQRYVPARSRAGATDSASGRQFTITTADTPGNSEGVSTTYKRLPGEVHKGDRILLADGLIELRVLSTTRQRIVCHVVNGGELGEHQGINLPGVKLRIPALTRERPGGPALCAGMRRQLHRRELRAHRGRRAGGQGRDRENRTENAGHCQAGKAGSHRESRRNSGGGRRRHGGARRSGRGDESRKRARIAKDADRQGQRSAHAGDHRNADAGVDDPQSPAHARRSFRRGQRDFRRHRRGDAQRGNGYGALPGGSREDDGPHHPRGRSQHHGLRAAPPQGL